MESKGTMEQIRELLAEGKSSGEVIALGYAPSTVYKVRRYMRLKTRQEDRQLPDREPAQNGRLDGGSSQEPQERVEGLEALLRGKEAEPETVHWQLRETSETAEASKRNLSARVGVLEAERDGWKRQAEWTAQKLEGERDTALRERDRVWEQCRQVRAERDRTQQRLDDLQRWLYSKNPHWEMELYHFLHPAVCTVGIDICTPERCPGLMVCHSGSRGHLQG